MPTMTLTEFLQHRELRGTVRNTGWVILEHVVKFELGLIAIIRTTGCPRVERLGIQSTSRRFGRSTEPIYASRRESWRVGTWTACA